MLTYRDGCYISKCRERKILQIFALIYIKNVDRLSFQTSCDFYSWDSIQLKFNALNLYQLIGWFEQMLLMPSNGGKDICCVLNAWQHAKNQHTNIYFIKFNAWVSANSSMEKRNNSRLMNKVGKNGD